MAVAYDAVAHTDFGSSTGSYTHTIGAGATNTALVVGVSYDPSGPDSHTDAGKSVSVTCDGVAMTELGTLVHSNGSNAGFVQMFGVAGLATGAHTIAASVTGYQTDDFVIMGSVSFTGVDQTTPFGTPQTHSGSGSSFSVAVSSATGDMVVDIACNGSGIDGSMQTSRWLNNLNGNSAAGNAAMSTAAGGSSVTMGYNVTDDWDAIIAVNVLAAGAGGSPQTVSMTGLGTASSIGSATAVPGNVDVALTGLGSAAAFGAATPAVGGVDVSVSGIASAGAFGTPSSSGGAISASVSGIPSAASFGTPATSPGGVVVAVSGVASASAFGTASAEDMTVQPSGVDSAAAFGTPSAHTPGEVTFDPAVHGGHYT